MQKFDPASCPRKYIPNLSAEVIEAEPHTGRYTLKLVGGPTETAAISIGAAEKHLKVGDKGIAVYYAWNRALHHRHWQFYPLGVEAPIHRKW